MMMNKYYLATGVKKIVVFAICFLCVFLDATAQKAQPLDFLIRGAWVFDGSGSDSIKTDVGIRDQIVVYIGDSKKEGIIADKVIDAEGKYLAPGFIDPHTHYGSLLKSKNPKERANIPCLSQGVTTIFLGNDGFGKFPTGPQLSSYDSNGIGTNVGLFIGLGGVRADVLGNKDVAPSASQLKEMENMVSQSMKEGAFGFSTGLFYAPQSYANTDEVIALSKVAASFGGVYDTHMRSENRELVAAVNETIEIGEATGIPLMISHIKCQGPAAWGTSNKIIKMVEDARAKGLNVTANQYPYNASFTSLRAMLIPRWAVSGGNKAMLKRFENADTLKRIIKGILKNLSLRGGDNKILLTSKGDSFLSGKTIHQLGIAWKVSPEDAVIRVLKKHPSISAISFSIDEDDVVNFMKQPWVMTGSDGGGGHPRTYGTFTKKIREYVMNKKILSMAEAIHRSTGETATFLGMNKRGFIKEGYYADIVIFNPLEITDNATYTSPKKWSSGIDYVFVNGTLAIEHGMYTGALPGKALRHKKE